MRVYFLNVSEHFLSLHDPKHNLGKKFSQNMVSSLTTRVKMLVKQEILCFLEKHIQRAH